MYKEILRCLRIATVTIIWMQNSTCSWKEEPSSLWRHSRSLPPPLTIWHIMTTWTTWIHN
jgi:hypothetical protein